MTELDAAERNYRNAIEESRKGKRELATELSAHGGLLPVQHPRPSQPATEPGFADFGVDPRDSESLLALRQAIDDHLGWENKAEEDNGDYLTRIRQVGELLRKEKPAPQPVEGVSDEELTCDAGASATSKRTMAALLRCVDRPDLFDVSLASVLYAFGLRREARSSAAKDARIAELLRAARNWSECEYGQDDRGTTTVEDELHAAVEALREPTP